MSPRNALAVAIRLLWVPMWLLGGLLAVPLGAVSSLILWIDRNDYHREVAWSLDAGAWWVLRHVAQTPAPLRKLAARVAPPTPSPDA